MPAQDTQPKVTSLSEWKKAKTHIVTLPSGSVVEVAIPDLPQLVKAGQIPNPLIDVAVKVASGQRPTRDDIIEHAGFFNKLAAMTVVKPQVSEEDFEAGVLPFEDKEMLVEFATRQRDLDAVGHHLAGLEKVEAFREARRIPGLDTGIPGL
jgi:hypothetical protein